METIRAIVTQCDEGTFEARLVDLDLVVFADVEEQLVEEIEHALEIEYQAAINHGYTPFVRLIPDTPSEDIETKWQRCESIKEERPIHLRDVVLMTLSAALHSSRNLQTFAFQRANAA